MPIPDFQTIMLPLLELLSDGQERKVVPEVTDALASRFSPTEDERPTWCCRG